MGGYSILSLLLVVTMLYGCCPIGVRGYKSFDYPTRGFYNTWRGFSQVKRMEAADRDEQALDGEVLYGDEDLNYSQTPIYYTNQMPKADDAPKPKKSQNNKNRLNNVSPSYRIKVLHARVPATVIFWP